MIGSQLASIFSNNNWFARDQPNWKWLWKSSKLDAQSGSCNGHDSPVRWTCNHLCDHSSSPKNQTKQLPWSQI